LHITKKSNRQGESAWPYREITWSACGLCRSLSAYENLSAPKLATLHFSHTNQPRPDIFVYLRYNTIVVGKYHMVAFANLMIGYQRTIAVYSIFAFAVINIWVSKNV
jgi:hypothetical protein